MINTLLHRQPTALDSVQHRELRLRLPVTDWSIADRLNAIFVATAEFADVCREYPIVFVRAGRGDDGADQVAPIAVLGLLPNDNLYLAGPHWRAGYMPAVLRSYPFCIARVDAERFAICVDMSNAAGAGDERALPVFQPDGQPAEVLATVRPQLEALESEVQRTQRTCSRLLELDLLRDMRFDATLPDGSKHSVDGFLTVDERKLTDLPDAAVVELHRSGVLGLVHLHWASLGNMRRLAEWHAERTAAAASTPPSDAAAPAAPAQQG